MKKPHAESYSSERLAELSLQQIKELRQRSAKPASRFNGPALVPQERGTDLPLSYAQERLWFLEQVGLVGSAYSLPFLLQLWGELNVEALERSFAELIRRHESLRTRFEAVAGGAVQIVDPPNRFALDVRDLSALENRDRLLQLQLLSAAEARRPFDLSREQPVRVLLLKLAQQQHVLLLTMHHIVADGWSFGVLNRELGALYRAYSQGRRSPLSELAVQYADFAIWQRRWMQGDLLRRLLQYWSERLRGAPPQLQLPTDRPRPAVASYRGAVVRFELSAELRGALEKVARHEGATLFMVVLASYQLLLCRYSGQEDVVVGSSIAGRTDANTEGLIGFFVNMLALRTDLGGNPGFRELLRRVKEVTLDAFAHQQLPFEKLVQGVRPERDLTRQPIFQVTLEVQSSSREPLELPGLDCAWVDVESGSAPFDLTLHLFAMPEGLRGEFQYATDLFDSATIERIAAQFRGLLEQISVDPECPIQTLALLRGSQRDEVLRAFNDTARFYPKDRLIHQLIEEQVQRTPGAVAVSGADRVMTYAELNARANRLANGLRERGVGPDVRVGLFLERSVEMVWGLLGILKAGGTYVPLDPSYPPERLAYMLRDSNPLLVLTQSWLKNSVPPTDVPMIALDASEDEWSSFPCSDLDPERLGLRTQNLAYIIYTSGSTGEPKGVMVAHGNLVSSTAARWPVYGELGRFLLLSPLGFDSSVAGIFGTLTRAGTLLIATQEMSRDPQLLGIAIRQLRATSLLCVPSLYRALLDVTGAWAAATLSRVIVAGESCPPTLIAESARCAPGVALFNEYGPTEATVWASFFECSNLESMSTVPIGRPIANAQIYILDTYREPVPIGVSGELYIGGAGVARGYLNRPELTAERFVKDPFSTDPQARMYRTGDLGRWRADGTIEYLGRNDHQVKIRGFRIELGEIEAQLVRHAQVKEAVVIAREDVPGEKRLVAYVIADAGGAAPGVEVLRAHLKVSLPEYMVPSAFVMLESLPLTSNGKLDRRALPAPELGAYASRRYEAPQGEVEEILAGIWQGLLHVERVGRNDNFFELGGHSLLIVQMMERLRRRGLSAEIRRVFESPTLADLAGALTRGVVGQFEVPPNRIPPGCEAIEPQMLSLVELEPQHIERIVRAVPGGAANIQDIYPLAALQEGILFHHLLDEQGGDIYARPMLLSLSSRERLEELITALQAVIDRHDVLRTAVLWEQLPGPVQVVYRQASLPIEEIALERDRDPVEQLRERMRPERLRLDLRQAPLMRLQVAADPQNGGQWYALLQLHHIVGDHVALEAVISEVVAHLEGHAQDLPESIPYRNHVAQALGYARTHDADAFFRSKLGEIDEPTAPFGLLDVQGDGSRIEEAHEELAAALAHRVRAQARRLGVSAATLFHAVWALVVSHTSGRDDVVFGSVLSGRLQGSAGAQRILGMFMNTLPLRLRLREVTARELVEQTQRELVELLGHEQASLAVAQRCSGISGSAPLFSTLLNYRHSAPNSESDWTKATGIGVLAVQERTNYPITVSVDDVGDGFALTAQTDRRIDAQRVLGYVSAGMGSLVEALEGSPQTPALLLSILPQGERRQVLELFNATQVFYPQEKLVHELFEEQVQRTPAAVAVVYEGQSLTYAQLNARANQLAWHLRDKGVGPDQLVGICVERSLEMVVGLLGILKAGGAYVPLDPAYPAERLAYMLEDASPKVLLIQERLRQSLPGTAAQLIALDDWSELGRLAAQNPPAAAVGLSADRLAYVIYTSGSTGQPKGVMIEHRNVVGFWQGLETLYPQTAELQRIAINASICFDASVQQLVQLLSGRSIFVVSEDTRMDASMLLSYADKNKIEGTDCTPSQLKAWVAAGLLEGGRRYPRMVLVGGEVIDTQLWNALGQSPDKEFYNVYGPTECTVDATFTRLRHGAPEPHIGRPMQNKRVYLLDRHRQPVPIGVSGELYIGGAGVARGYLNRPELTAERFVKDPFSTDPQARMYRTGDLGRWRADGTIEYLGRNDHQVKIRGFRIELGEIEAQLVRHAQVKEAVVIAREDVPGEKRLVAYVIADAGGAAPGVEVLRAHLKVSLPEYMVPSAFVMLESLPLTSNGKLDRRALPAPELGAYASRRYEAPQGEVEEILAGIWQGLLHVERVGRNDNFFELGGHSLMATQVIVRVRSSLSLEIPLRSLFKFPTIKDLAVQVDRLCQVRLLERVGDGGNDARDLLEKVASMPDSEVQRILRELRMGATP